MGVDVVLKPVNSHQYVPFINGEMIQDCYNFSIEVGLKGGPILKLNLRKRNPEGNLYTTGGGYIACKTEYYPVDSLSIGEPYVEFNP